MTPCIACSRTDRPIDAQGWCDVCRRKGACGDLSLRGQVCQRPTGHDGAHMQFDTNGTHAWGMAFDNTPRTGYRP